MKSIIQKVLKLKTINRITFRKNHFKCDPLSIISSIFQNALDFKLTIDFR